MVGLHLFFSVQTSGGLFHFFSQAIAPVFEPYTMLPGPPETLGNRSNAKI
jgi:hypothetical protein